MTQAQMIVTEASDLKRVYSDRDKQFKKDFDLLDLVDELFQEGMESFVSNDPRTTWNMSTYLLQPRPMVHELVSPFGDSFNVEESNAIRVIERLLSRIWTRHNKMFMRRGGSTYYWSLIGTLTGTGWYAVPNGMMADRFFIDLWEPITVFPEFDDSGLVKLARIQTMPWRVAQARAKREGWDVKSLPTQRKNVTEYQLWIKEDDKVSMGVVVESSVVFAFQDMHLKQIPVTVGAVGGLPTFALGMVNQSNDPDRLGTRSSAALKGQSIMATNERIFKNLNKQLTFLQQLLKDTANPPTWEQGEGQTPIVANPDDLHKRNAHFRFGPNEMIGKLGQSPIPVEAQQLIFTLRNMLQRGGISDITLGNVVGEVTATLAAQVAESTQQILHPYHQGVEYIASTVNQNWIDTIIKSPGTYKKLLSSIEIAAFELLKDIELEAIASYAIKIPGDLAQRLILAKQASPEFKLSKETTMKLFLPEITDIPSETRLIDRESAQENPVFKNISLIHALREASLATKDSNPAFSQLYTQSADSLLQAPQEVQPGQGVVNGTTPRF